MSANLRRVLDTTHLNERRQVGELLQAIRNAALKLRDTPPENDEFFHIEDFPDVFATMSRPLWQAPDSVTLTGNIENNTEEVGLDELRRFRNLPQIRLEELPAQRDGLSRTRTDSHVATGIGRFSTASRHDGSRWLYRRRCQ